tara:strand:- start:5500 stop:8205 length:2706 start_codon:yes stop_codon:yes gene_type:complete
MAIGCHSQPKLLAWEKSADELYTKWSTDPFIRKRFTSERKGNIEYMEMESLKAFKEWMNEKMDLPFEQSAPYNESQIKKADLYIKEYSNNLKGSFKNLAFLVPEGISKQDPSSRKLHLGMNEIIDTERVNINTLQYNSRVTQESLELAYLQEYGKKIGKKKYKELRDSREKMITAKDTEAFNKYERAFINIVEGDNGKIIVDYRELIEMPKDQFGRISNKDFTTERLNIDTGESETSKRSYAPETVLAAKASRALLKSIGLTYVKGISQIENILTEQFRYNSNKSEGDKLVKRLKEARVNLEGDIKKEGYFPHVLFENLNDIKTRLSESFDTKNGNVLNYEKTYKDITESILNAASSSMPDAARKRNPLLKSQYEKDPLLAITQYSNEAIQFNKLAHTQSLYLKTLKSIPNNNSLFTKQLSRFIQEQYAVFTEGTTQRSAFANNAVTVLNSLQTAMTMGLNVTGGIKNAASIMHFYTRIGHKGTQDALSAYIHNRNVGISKDKESSVKGDKVGFRDFVTEAEKEAGFLFTESATELYAEGTADLRSLSNSKSYEFDPLSGKIAFKGTSIKDALIKASRWTLQSGLWLHRATENSQRRWMYRTALYHQYNKLSELGYDSTIAKTESKKWALKMVNSWAYEYASHAKSKLVRGEWRTVEEMNDGQTIDRRLKKGSLGAMSEIAFHLLHYPSSLFETQYDNLKKAHKGFLSGEGFKSEEIQWAARQAGVLSLIQLASIVVNSDISNIFENETLQRLENVVKDITSYDDDEKSTFGLMSEFTGPTIGQLKRGLIAQGIIDLDESTFNKIMFGNVNFGDKNDEKAVRLDKYKYGTFAGVTSNKILPTLQGGRGRDLFTHYLKLYPSETTKKYNKILFNRKDKVKKPKRAAGMSDNLRASLALLQNS